MKETKRTPQLLLRKISISSTSGALARGLKLHQRKSSFLPFPLQYLKYRGNFHNLFTGKKNAYNL